MLVIREVNVKKKKKTLQVLEEHVREFAYTGWHRLSGENSKLETIKKDW